LYANVAKRVERFEVLHERPRIILWRGSDKDDTRPFVEALRTYGYAAELVTCTNSVHKMPERALRMVREELLQHGPRAVVIAYVGRSNGAGPVFAADTHVPVIAVPASAKDFPADVWSSLRMPSDVPLMTVLDPANAIQAALGILSARSPHAYKARRTIVEYYKLDGTNSPTFGK
jgi:phosphoribosylaminoimidazole carboxylase PurE protein